MLTKEFARGLGQELYFQGQKYPTQNLKADLEKDSFLKNKLKDIYKISEENSDFLQYYDGLLWDSVLPYMRASLTKKIFDEGINTPEFLHPEKIKINFVEVDSVVYSIGEAENYRFTNGRVLPGKTIVVYQYDNKAKKFEWVDVAATNSLLERLIMGDERSQTVENADINQAAENEIKRLDTILTSLSKNDDLSKQEIHSTITEMKKLFANEVDIGLLIKVASDTLNYTNNDSKKFYEDASELLDQEYLLHVNFIQPVLTILNNIINKQQNNVLIDKAKLATINYARNPTASNKGALLGVAKEVMSKDEHHGKLLTLLISENISRNTISAAAEKKATDNINNLINSGLDEKVAIGKKIADIKKKYSGVNVDYLNQLAENTLKNNPGDSNAVVSAALDREEMLQDIFINPILKHIESIKILHAKDVNLDLLDRVEKEIKSFSGNPNKMIGSDFYKLAAEVEAEYSVFTWGKGFALLMVVAVISLSVLTVLSAGGFLPLELAMLGAMYEAAAGGAAAIGVSVAATAVAGAGAVETYNANRKQMRPLYENMQQAKIPSKTSTPSASPSFSNQTNQANQKK